MGEKRKICVECVWHNSRQAPFSGTIRHVCQHPDHVVPPKMNFVTGEMDPPARG